MKPFRSPEVASKFKSYPDDVRQRLMRLRELVFDVAAATSGVGRIEESLRWGEPAYLTSETRSGSTIRIGWKPSRPMRYAMYFTCTTTLIETFRAQFPAEFNFEGNRAIVFEVDETVPEDAVRSCIAAALTYRRQSANGARNAPSASG